MDPHDALLRLGCSRKLQSGGVFLEENPLRLLVVFDIEILVHNWVAGVSFIKQLVQQREKCAVGRLFQKAAER